jgi:hypothetical protein
MDALPAPGRTRRPFFHAGVVVALSVIPALPGCATPTLMRAAEGLGEAALRLEVLGINGAYKVRPEEALVCLHVSDLDTRREREMTLRIPLQDRKRWKLHPMPDEHTDPARAAPESTRKINTYVEFRPLPEDLSPGCLADGERLPVIHATGNVVPDGPMPDWEIPSLRFPEGASDAIYVISRKGFPVNIGYVSAEPIVKSGYAIDVPADHLRAVRAQGDSRPYLYLFMPVAVVIDATIGLVVLAASGYNQPGYHYSPVPSGSR